MASCGRGTTNPSRTREHVARVGGACLGVLFLGLEGSMYIMYRSVPPAVPEPRPAPGTRHIPSLLLVRILYGGQSKWAGRKMGHVESFSLLQISLTSSAPRFASLVQSIEVQRLVGSKDGAICHITRPVPLCIAPGFYPAATCAPELSPGLARPVGPRHTRTALVTLLVQIPPALHAS